jgi:hypothetical protein
MSHIVIINSVNNLYSASGKTLNFKSFNPLADHSARAQSASGFHNDKQTNCPRTVSAMHILHSLLLGVGYNQYFTVKINTTFINFVLVPLVLSSSTRNKQILNTGSDFKISVLRI